MPATYIAPTLNDGSGAVTLPAISAGRRINIGLVGARRMASGLMIVDVTAEKLMWEMEWRALTTANKNIVHSQWLLTPTQTFTDWTSVSNTYTVHTYLHNYEEEAVQVAGGKLRWNVRVTLEEL